MNWVSAAATVAHGSRIIQDFPKSGALASEWPLTSHAAACIALHATGPPGRSSMAVPSRRPHHPFLPHEEGPPRLQHGLRTRPPAGVNSFPRERSTAELGHRTRH